MTEDRDIADSVLTHGGWIAAALVSLWGWVMKMALGDVRASLTRIEDKLDHNAQRISHIEGQLGIEPHAEERS